ncbi:MAG: AAA-like domain-containing protein [Candidatus Omnitrophota bacterium]
MTKEFNITGVCTPELHYMVDISDKITEIMKLVERGKYFVIHRPRQYGKTSTLLRLERGLKKNNRYLIIDTTFEGIDAPTYAEQKLFLPVFLDLLRKSLAFSQENELANLIDSQNPIVDFNGLSNFITAFVQKSGRNVVLLIDEVDKASDNRLFLDFLGMLRAKYLKRIEGKDSTFHSVILAGVHDVKTLKSQIRPDEEKKFNSPWNIAVDFKVDLSFFPKEIATMLAQYAAEQQVKLDIPLFSERLYYYTSGYPFLVSNLCKIIDEEVMAERTPKEWKPEDLEKAVQITLKQNNTNFESLITNLENNADLYQFIFNLVMEGSTFAYNSDSPVIHLGEIYGILREENGLARVHNRIYEQRIYNYMASAVKILSGAQIRNLTDNYIDEKGKLDVQKIFLKYRDFMNENYSQKDMDFIERNGRLLFLAFIRPIINGRGFDFKEVQISEEKRLDVVITFDNKKYIIELKIWRGNAYHREGIRQLCDYLDRQNENHGYLLIYDLRKESGQTGKLETIIEEGKTIVAAWV